MYSYKLTSECEQFAVTRKLESQHNMSEIEDLTFMLPRGVKPVTKPLTLWTSSLEVKIWNLDPFNP